MTTGAQSWSGDSLRAPRRFEIGVSVNQRSASVDLEGELDLAAAGRLRAVVASIVGLPGIASIGVDAGRLDFVDWVGLQSLLQAREDACDAGVVWFLASASPALRRILDLADVGLELAHPCMN